MAYPLYDYRATSVTVAQNPSFTLLLPGSPYRICVIISSITVGSVLLTDRQTTNATGSLAVFATPGFVVLPYRDYGPAIQHELWGAMLAAVSGVVNVIEVFSVPRG